MWVRQMIYSFLPRRKKLTAIVLMIFIVTFLVNAVASDKKPLIKDWGCKNLSNNLIKEYYPNYTLVQLKDLDNDLQEYFTATYHNSHPGCIQEDFDGDGLADYALLLRAKTKDKTIERISVLKGKKEQSFISINLDELKDRVGSFFIRYVPPGKIKEWNTNKTMVISRPAFELVLFEAASRVYFWQEDKFHFIQTSD